MVIRVVSPDTRKDMTIKEYVVWYLGNVKRKAFVHEMFRDFTLYSSKKPMKYTSFRTEVAWLKKKGHIVSAGRENDDDPFAKSYYKLPA
jgi:hypothetical protein